MFGMKNPMPMLLIANQTAWRAARGHARSLSKEFQFLVLGSRGSENRNKQTAENLVLYIYIYPIGYMICVSVYIYISYMIYDI